MLGNSTRGGCEVRSLELAVCDSVDGGRDGLSERLLQVRLGGGEGGVVLENGAGHLVGDLFGKLALGTTSVAADEVRDQRADCEA